MWLQWSLNLLKPFSKFSTLALQNPSLTLQNPFLTLQNLLLLYKTLPLHYKTIPLRFRSRMKNTFHTILICQCTTCKCIYYNTLRKDNTPPPRCTLLDQSNMLQVGSICVQLAKSFGLKVFATAGTPSGSSLVKDLGAEFTYNHRESGYIDKIKVSQCNCCMTEEGGSSEGRCSTSNVVSVKAVQWHSQIGLVVLLVLSLSLVEALNNKFVNVSQLCMKKFGKVL